MRGWALLHFSVLVVVSACVRTAQPATSHAVDHSALTALIREAERHHSSAVVVWHAGQLLGEWYFDGEPRRIESMSATKAVVNLAIGMLIDDGRIASVDEPVATFFPEWRSDRVRSSITLRHLLSHTSGLQADVDSAEVLSAENCVALALSAAVIDVPGHRYFYNNKAVNLLPAIAAKASGEDFIDFLFRRLFKPLGIEDVFWVGDQAGNPYGMSGLQIRAGDFAKIGQLLLDQGRWKGQQIVSQTWISQSTALAGQSMDPTSGLLWWRKFERREISVPVGAASALRARGVPAEEVAAIESIEGRQFPDVVALLRPLHDRVGQARMLKLWAEVKAAGIATALRVHGEPDGFAAQGSLGQYLLVLPSRRLVAVRMAEGDDAVPWHEIEFRQFEDLVRALVRP